MLLCVSDVYDHWSNISHARIKHANGCTVKRSIIIRQQIQKPGLLLPTEGPSFPCGCLDEVMKRKGSEADVMMRMVEAATGSPLMVNACISVGWERARTEDSATKEDIHDFTVFANGRLWCANKYRSVMSRMVMVCKFLRRLLNGGLRQTTLSLYALLPTSLLADWTAFGRFAVGNSKWPRKNPNIILLCS